MIRSTDNVKNQPGKRFDTLDVGFLSSKLWTDNKVTIVGSSNGPKVELRLVPKFGAKDKRHDNVWIDVNTLKILKREKYRGSGEMRIRHIYTAYETLVGKLPIATTSTMYNASGEKMGTVTYRNVKANVGISDSLFSMSQR
jgi:outer membrane lipoprotein-sorting protein